MNTARKKKANSENDTLIAWEFDNVVFFNKFTSIPIIFRTTIELITIFKQLEIFFEFTYMEFS